MVPPPKGSLQLRLSAAASPERVYVAAGLFRDLLRAISPSLAEESVTLVVSNFAMTAGLRPQDPSGKSTVDALIRFLAKPIKEANRRPGFASAAELITTYGPKLAPYGAEFWTPRRLLCKVDDELAVLMKRVSSGRARRLLRGDTTIYSPVLRVGRTDDQSTVRARVSISGKARDIAIKQGQAEPFFDAAKHGRLCRVSVEAFWYRDEEGELELYVPKSRLVSVSELKAVNGADTMQAAMDCPFQLFDNVEDVIDGLLQEN